MTRPPALAESTAASDATVEALRSLAIALRPFLTALDDAERTDTALVDVCAFVPASRRVTMRACRDGRIAGAACVGRKWVATRGAVNSWLRALGSKAAPARADGSWGDEFDELRKSLARTGPAPRRRRAGL